MPWACLRPVRFVGLCVALVSIIRRLLLVNSIVVLGSVSSWTGIHTYNHTCIHHRIVVRFYYHFSILITVRLSASSMTTGERNRVRHTSHVPTEHTFKS